MIEFHTADTHLGHRGIIHSCNRPFAFVRDMDEYIVERWNSVVGDQDTVWHQGDVLFKNEHLLSRLKGKKMLIIGNHDYKKLNILKKYFTIHDRDIVVDKRRKIVMSHYPLLSWPHQHRGWRHLHGHSHGNLPPRPNTVDVGVDCWHFTPKTLEELFP